MRDPLKPTLRQKMVQSRQLILWMLVLAVPLAIGFYFLAESQEIEPTNEVATVVSFGERPFEDGPRPLMNIEMADGNTQTVFIAARVIRSCEHGDKVLLQRRGMNLRVAPEACDLPENSE